MANLSHVYKQHLQCRAFPVQKLQVQISILLSVTVTLYTQLVYSIYHRKSKPKHLCMFLKKGRFQKMDGQLDGSWQFWQNLPPANQELLFFALKPWHTEPASYRSLSLSYPLLCNIGNVIIALHVTLHCVYIFIVIMLISNCDVIIVILLEALKFAFEFLIHV